MHLTTRKFVLHLLIVIFCVSEGKICYLVSKKSGYGCWRLAANTGSKNCDVISLGGYAETMKDVTTKGRTTNNRQSLSTSASETMKDVTTKGRTTNDRQSSSTSASACPLDYLAFNGSCYKFVNDTLLSRSASRSACEADSAHLVFIDNEEESDFIVNQTSMNTGYWIGLVGYPGHFYWDSGLQLASGAYHGFSLTELKNLDDVNNCFIYIQKEFLIWRDEPCLEHFGFICEYEDNQRTFQCPGDSYYCINKTTDVDPVDVVSKFPVDTSTLAYFDGIPYELQRVNLTGGNHHFVQFYGSSWCSFMVNTGCVNWTEWSNSSYLYVNTEMTWNSAAEACHFYGEGSHLVSIQNHDENEFVRSLNKSVWIGLSDQDEEGVWRWHDASSVTYTNWSPYEPNNWNYEQHCTFMSEVDGLWDDRRCLGEYHFVCEKEL